MTWPSRERHLLPSPTTLVQSLGPPTTTWSRNVTLLTQSFLQWRTVHGLPVYNKPCVSIPVCHATLTRAHTDTCSLSCCQRLASHPVLGFRFCCHPQPVGDPPTVDMGGRGETRKQPRSGFCGPASSPREQQSLLDRVWCGPSKGAAERRKLRSAWRGYTLAPLSS